MARVSTSCTIFCVSAGRLRKSLTVAVSIWSCTCGVSSSNDSRKDSSSSSALSMRSAYSPMIQIIEAFASGSSSVSRFSQRVPMIDSYRLGNLRKMSLMTMTASCTT